MDTDKIKAKLYDYFCKEAGVIAYDSDRDGEYSRELVDILSIGRISYTEYPDMNAELREEPSRQTMYFDSDSINDDDCVINRMVISNGAIAKISVYPSYGHFWDEEEKEYVRGFLLIISTIKSRIRMKEYIDYAIFHEMELGYFNPFYLTRMMGMVLKLERISDYSIIFFNLVNLSGLNTLLGRKETDKVMKKFTGTVSDMLDSPECLCRMGGDNFCVFARREKVPDILGILEGIHINVESGDVSVVKLGAYCGIYDCTGKEKSINECLDNAQATMLMAKHNRNTQIQYFDRAMIEMLTNQRQIESCFKAAIRNEEFKAFYQPKVNLANYKLVGAEALCRWFRNGEQVMPDQFIPVLERSKRICVLDLYILDHVCADLAAWIAEGKKPVRISSNFSRKHLSNPNFVKEVTAIVDKHGIPHSLIVIEVTETTSESDMIRLQKLVDEFAKEGFEVSVDDFGVGYSSMSMIKDIPFSEIKIDKSFLDNADISNRDMVMMKHIISIASDLDMSSIAEGVETPDHVKLLKKYGCYHGQGYFFDKPLPKEQFEKVLTSPDYHEKGLDYV
ncbi:MAG: GGDEF domain-containing phosphodiesterase [Lachnospiraceae bacterium]|nr:GGDEF domain-containing phosphodiesterase [Lachnospiraceae bacterium]